MNRLLKVKGNQKNSSRCPCFHLDFVSISYDPIKNPTTTTTP